MLFVSNQNFNLGSESDQQKQAEQIEHCIEEMTNNIASTKEQYDSSGIMLQDGRAFVELLGNAFQEKRVEKDSDKGETRDLYRKWICHRFLDRLHKVRTATVRHLQRIRGEQTDEQRQQWSIENLSENLGVIWKKVYYDMNLFNENGIKNKIISHETEIVVQAELDRLVEALQVKRNYLVEGARHLLERTEPDKSDPGSVEFAKVFGGETPKLVEWLSSTDPLDEAHLEREGECYQADVKALRRHWDQQERDAKKRVREWVYEKNQNKSNTIRKQMTWDERRVMDVWDRRCALISFFRGVHEFNYFFLARLRALEHFLAGVQSRIQSSIEQEYLAYKRSHPESFGDFAQGLDKRIETLKQGQNDPARRVFWRDPGEIETVVVDKLELIFRGLFERFKSDSSKRFWEVADFEKKAQAHLEQISQEQFYVDITVIRRFDYEIEERLVGNTLVDFEDKVDISSECLLKPTSADALRKAVQQYVNDSKRDFFAEGKGSEKLEALIDDLENGGLLARNPQNEVKDAVLDSPEKVKKFLKKLEWDISPDPELVEARLRRCPDSACQHVLARRPLAPGAEPEHDVLFVRKRVTWKREYLERLDSDTSTQSTRDLVRAEDLNYFFSPQDCFSLDKLRSIFSKVLASNGYQKRLVSQVVLKTQELLDSLVNPETPREMFDLSFFKMQGLKRSVVDPLIKRLNREAYLHGACIAYALEEAVVHLVYQRVKTFFRDAIGRFWEQTMDKEVNCDMAGVREEIRANIIEEDMKKLQKLRLEKQYKKLEPQFEAKLLRDYNRFIKPSVSGMRSRLKNKVSYVAEFETRLFGEKGTSRSPQASVLDHFLHPEKLMESEFDRIYDTMLGSAVSASQNKNFEITVTRELDSTLKYFKKIRDLLVEHRFDDDLRIKQTVENNRENQSASKQLCGEFRAKLLRSVIETGKLNPNYSTKIRRVKVHAEMANSSKTGPVFVGKGSLMAFVLTRQMDPVESLTGFVGSLLQVLEKLQEKFKNDQSLRGRVMSVGRFADLKQEMRVELIGCTERCPVCNRVCQKGLNHDGPHSTGQLGHGIINIHRTNSKRKTRLSEHSLLEWERFPPMQLQFCDDCDEDQLVLFGDKQRKWAKVVKSDACREWDFAATPDAPHGKRFRDICRAYWAESGESHCRNNHFMHVESSRGPFVFLFGNVKLFGEEKQEAGNKKRFYLALNDEFKSFNKHLSRLHPKSQTSYFTLATAAGGKQTVVTEYKKGIKGPRQIRTRLRLNYHKSDNRVENKLSFEAIDKLVRDKLASYESRQLFFVFGLEKLSKIDFESEAVAKGLSKELTVKAGLRAIVFSSSKSKNKKYEKKLAAYFGKKGTKVVEYSQIHKLKPRFLTKQLRINLE